MGERGNEELRIQIQKELGLDLSFSKQYLLYLNDLSPISIHNENNVESRVYLDPENYTFCKIIPFSANRTLVLKKPFLRRSYQNGRSVSQIILESFPGTAILAIVAILFALLIGVSIGIVSALTKGSFFDKSSLFVAVLGMSGPSFFLAIILSWVGGYLWFQQTKLPAIPIIFLLIAILLFVTKYFKKKEFSWTKFLSVSFKALFIGIAVWIIGAILESISGFSILPFSNSYLILPGTGLNQTGSLKEVDVFTGPYYEWKNLILPAITLGIRPLAVVVQLMRNSMIDIMEQDFIRTARAKGLSTWRIVTGHALRNAISPVITAISGWFASMLAGAVFIEYVFGWQGLGLRIYEALINEDMPLVMGSVLFIATIFVVINTLVDLIYGLLDPRIS